MIISIINMSVARSNEWGKKLTDLIIILYYY